MTITPEAPAASPAAAAVAGLKVAFEAALTAVREEQWRSSDGEVKGQVVDTHQFLALALSLHLSSVAERDERGIAEVDGAISSRAWLRHRLNETPARRHSPRSWQSRAPRKARTRRSVPRWPPAK